MISIAISIVLAIVAVTSSYIAWHQYRLNRSDHVDTELRATIRQTASEALEPIRTTLAAHTVQLTQHADRDARTEDSIKQNSVYIRDLTDKMTQMSVKVDMYWTTLEQLAMNAAKGLHQPHPERARLDHLLEAFIEGTLTGDERTELKKLLVLIRNYEPGGPRLEFPVLQGEQTFAAILLSTMDMVDPQHLATMGHSLHRSVKHKELKNGQD